MSPEAGGADVVHSGTDPTIQTVLVVAVARGTSVGTRHQTLQGERENPIVVRDRDARGQTVQLGYRLGGGDRVIVRKGMKTQARETHSSERRHDDGQPSPRLSEFGQRRLKPSPLL
jgi:hypothetical protein